MGRAAPDPRLEENKTPEKGFEEGKKAGNGQRFLNKRRKKKKKIQGGSGHCKNREWVGVYGILWEKRGKRESRRKYLGRRFGQYKKGISTV